MKRGKVGNRFAVPTVGMCIILRCSESYCYVCVEFEFNNKSLKHTKNDFKVKTICQSIFPLIKKTTNITKILISIFI